jgi:hypothetical protein
VVGVALVPFRGSIGLENVAIVYLAVVALTSAVGGRAAGLVAALSAALSYNWFFTTPYYTLRIDSVSQVVTVVLLFAAGLLASLGGRANRRAGARVREDEDAIRALHAISQAAAAGDSPDRVAAEQLLALVDARAVQVVRDEEGSDQVVAAAGEPVGQLDVDALPHLDEEGRIPLRAPALGRRHAGAARRGGGGRHGPRPDPRRRPGGRPPPRPPDPADHAHGHRRRRPRSGHPLTGRESRLLRSPHGRDAQAWHPGDLPPWLGAGHAARG